MKLGFAKVSSVGRGCFHTINNIAIATALGASVAFLAVLMTKDGGMER